MLAVSLKTYGAGRSILADRSGIVIAGNKTFEEARALGLGIRVVQTAGDELVVVQRTNLDLATDPAARELALADNRVGELNLEWDAALLAGLAAQGINLEGLWTPQELEQVIGHGPRDGHTDEDAVVPIADTTIQLGDVFELGSHRLLCGDATDAHAVARVMMDDAAAIMITDPPYGVAYDPAWRVRAGRGGRHAVGPVANDDRVDWGAAFALLVGAPSLVVFLVLNAATHAEFARHVLAEHLEL